MNLIGKLKGEVRIKNKKVEKLDDLQSISSLLNVEGLRRAPLIGGSWKARKMTGDQVLLCSTRGIPTSLTLLSKNETDMAVEMFDEIMETVQLSHGPSNEQRRSEILTSILNKAETLTMRREVYFQLIKQSRGNGDLHLERNVWSLFEKISKERECPQEILQFVLRYVMAVAFSRQEDPFVRSLAFQTLIPLKSTAGGHRGDALTSDWHLSGELFTCQAMLADGSIQEVVYDEVSTVAEAMYQMAWSLGLPRLKDFALYLETDGEPYPLNPDIVLMTLFSKEDGTNKKGLTKLTFKKEMFRKKDKRIIDPDYVYYMYLQLRRMYLDNGYPVTINEAVQLCALQMQADNDPEALDDDQAIAKAISNCIPQKCYAEHNPEELTKSVHDYLEHSSRHSREEARRSFLGMLRKMPYGSCVFFNVLTTEYFPVSLPYRSELKMGIKADRLNFFLRDMSECIVSAHIARVSSCTATDGTVIFKIGWITEWCHFTLTTRHAEEIVRIVQKFKKDMARAKTRLPAKGRTKILAVQPTIEVSPVSHAETSVGSPKESKNRRPLFYSLKDSRRASPEISSETEGGTPRIVEYQEKKENKEESIVLEGKSEAQEEAVVHPSVTETKEKIVDHKNKTETKEEAVIKHAKAEVKKEVVKKPAIFDTHKRKEKKKTGLMAAIANKGKWKFRKASIQSPSPEHLHKENSDEDHDSSTSDSARNVEEELTDENEVDPSVDDPTVEEPAAGQLIIHPDYEKTRLGALEESALPFDALNDLQEGTLFAQKYKIMSQRLGRKSDKFLAQRVRPNQQVILKFYGSANVFGYSRRFHKRLLKSPHVCKMVEYLNKEVGFPACIVFEVGNITLRNWIRQQQPNLFERKSVLRQILLGLVEIHEAGVVHGDLKPDRVMLFESDDTWKLLEFDSASEANEPASQINTTVTYAAPEIIRAEKEGKTDFIPRPSSDMWSFGILAYETITGRRFYGSNVSSAGVREVLTSEESFPGIEGIENTNTAAFIGKLLKKIPRDRMTAKEALEHPFFDSDE